jgi:hypothetical protein
VEALSPATPRKVEDIFVSMRSDLLRIITKWEQSGQGEGGRDAEEEYQEGSFYGTPSSSLTGVSDPRESIGCLAGRPSRALQSRAAFFNGRPSYLLFFWEVADLHQLLQSLLQRLNNSIAASDGSFAAVSTTAPRSQHRRQRREEDDDDDSPPGLEASVHLLSQSISELAECQRQVLRDQAEQI